MTFSRPTSFLNWRTASRNGSPSMSPTVPPTSTMTTSVSRETFRMDDLISSVMCGITVTLRPELVAAPLLLDDGVVDLTGRHVVVAGHPARGEPFVVAEVQIG